jgi:hypothetical protein
MNAKGPLTCPLRVEHLECRDLPNGATPVSPVVPSTEPVAGASVQARPAYPTGTTAGDYDDGDQDESASTQVAIPVQDQQPGVREETTGTARGLPDREREYEAHEARQLFREEPHDRFAHAAITTVPVASPGTPDPAAATASSSRHQPSAEFGAPTPSMTVAAAAQVSGPVEPDQAVRTPVDHGLPAPTRTDAPPPPDAVPAPDADTPVYDAPTARPWRDILLDPLGGVPLREAVSVNLSALGDEAEQFLSHVVSLGAEQADGAEWSQYVWLAGGLALVCGGVQFVRAVRAQRGAADSRLTPEQPEETR